MLSHSQLKALRALAQKKHRDAEGLFLAEGPKVVGDLQGWMPCRLLAATPDYLARHPRVSAQTVVTITPDELSRASSLRTPRDVIAIYEKPKADAAADAAHLTALPEHELCLALDGVQDPGNVGTILRIADWFGLRHVFLSPESADPFAPKTVQATMGALARVAVHTVDMTAWLQRLAPTVPVYGTFLRESSDLYAAPLTATGVIVMGNEGGGISADVERCVTERLFIPNFPQGSPTSESLNVAIATAITVAEFRRRMQ